MELIDIKLIDGIIITGFKGDHITNTIARYTSYYEKVMLDYIKTNISKGIMIDVGANIGNHSIYLAKYCATKVIAYEPFPTTYSLLERNIIQNNISNVQLMNLALGNINDEVFMSSVEGNAGMNQIRDNASEWSKDYCTCVKVVSFDSTVGKTLSEPVTLIKIDCEGYEEKAIIGMIETIKKHKPALFIECKTILELNEIRKLLGPLGYKDVCKFNATPTYYFKHENQ